MDKSIILGCDEAKEQLGKIEGNMSHDFYKLQADKYDHAHRYRNRLVEIIASGSPGSLEGPLVEFHYSVNKVWLEAVSAYPWARKQSRIPRPSLGAARFWPTIYTWRQDVCHVDWNPMAQDTQKLTIYLPPKLIADLKHKAIDDKKTASELIGEALREFLEKKRR